jgi:hypothetical protein
MVAGIVVCLTLSADVALTGAQHRARAVRPSGAGAQWTLQSHPQDALHTLTVGAIGTMTLAVMTRASLGHTGRPLMARPSTRAIYALVTLATLLACPLTASGRWDDDHAVGDRRIMDGGVRIVRGSLRQSADTPSRYGA